MCVLSKLVLIFALGVVNKLWNALWEIHTPGGGLLALKGPNQDLGLGICAYYSFVTYVFLQLHMRTFFKHEMFKTEFRTIEYFSIGEMHVLWGMWTP